MSRLQFIAVVLFASAALAAGADTPIPPASELGPVHLVVGKSAVINSKIPLSRVLSSNPQVIETVGVSPTQVVVEGKAAGVSSLMLWDEAGQSQVVDVTVDIDLSAFRAAVDRSYPGQPIDIRADGPRVILTGNVSSQHSIDDLGKMAGQYSGQVVNSLAVPSMHDRQVMLAVRFVEVDRTRIEQFGINILSTGAANTPGVISTQQFGAPSLGSSSSSGGVPGKLPISVSDILNIFLFRPDLNLGLTIKDLQEKNILQILAEPNLLALNGQKATFLAGGEFPFPVVQGSQNLGAVTIQFRPFGVKLDFTATIDADKVIRLHVAPEVSTLDFTNAVTISGSVVPAISTRRAETEIELKDGQSFGIAGLIDNRNTTQLSKVPGLGDIPILGQMFRSHSINRSNSELMVLVTPHVVDPVHVDTPAPVVPPAPLPFLDRPKFDESLPDHQDAGKAPSEPGAK